MTNFGGKYILKYKVHMKIYIKSECPRKSKLGKLQKIDFLLTKHIEGYWYGIK